MKPVLSRRSFIKASALTISTSIVDLPASLSAFDAQKAQSLTKKSLKFQMIDEDLSIVEKFRMLQELGFDGVELLSPNDLDKKEVLQAQDATGLAIPGVINSAHWKFPLSHPDEKVRSKCIAATKTAIKDCKDFGGDTVLLVAGVVNDEISYQDTYQRTKKEIHNLIPELEKTGIKIAIENVWNNFLLSPVEAANYLDDINHPLVGWYFDVGNILRYGWPEHWIQVLGKRIFKIDVKEFSRKKMNEQGLWKGFDVKLTEGDVDWLKVNQALTEVGYNGWGSAEVKGGKRERIAEISSLMDKIYQMK